MHFYMNMSTRQHRAGPPCPPVGSGRPVCGAGDLTRPAHRTSAIRSGRGGPPGRRRFPWMYTGTPRSAAVREPDLSPVARILPPRCPVQHLSGGRRSPGPVTDLARGYVARHDTHARSPRGCARTCSRRWCGWPKRCASSKPSRTCHRRLGSVDEPSVGVQAFLLQAISCDAGTAR